MSFGRGVSPFIACIRTRTCFPAGLTILIPRVRVERNIDKKELQEAVKYGQ